MINAILGVAAVLILVILILFFRIQGLVGILRSSEDNKDGLTNRFNASMFLIFLVVGLFGFFYFSFKYFEDYNLPEAVSVHGKVTDSLFWITTGIITFVFVITQILLFGFAFKYRYKKERKASFFPENHSLEFIWTIIPAIVLTLLVFQGWKAWRDITEIPDRKFDPERVELEIVGQQFAWRARYPGADSKLGAHNFRMIDDINYFGFDVADENVWDDFTPQEIHIPVGKSVLFRIRSKDVLHSVFAPHFRLKMDAVPGMPTQFYFTPTKTTEQMRSELSSNPNYQKLGESGEPLWKTFDYEIACAEMCGISHFNMRYVIVVETVENYKKWLAEQTPWVLDNKDYVVKSLGSDKDAVNKLLKLYPNEEVVVQSANQNAVDTTIAVNNASLTIETDKSEKKPGFVKRVVNTVTGNSEKNQ